MPEHTKLTNKKIYRGRASVKFVFHMLGFCYFFFDVVKLGRQVNFGLNKIIDINNKLCWGSLVNYLELDPKTFWV